MDYQLLRLACFSWMAWQFFSTLRMKARLMWSQWALSYPVLRQYSSMLRMFFLRCGSAILAQTISKSIMVSILNMIFSWKWMQEIALKVRKRSFRLDFPEVFQTNQRVMLFQLQVRQLQWNIRISVFQTFSSMLVTQRTQSKFFPDQNQTRYSPRAKAFYFYLPYLLPQSYSDTSQANTCSLLPIMPQSNSALNFLRGLSLTNNLMKYLRESCAPSTSPMIYGFQLLLLLGCISFLEFSLILCSEKTTLCLSRSRTLSQMLIQIRRALYCWSRLL